MPVVVASNRPSTCDPVFAGSTCDPLRWRPQATRDSGHLAFGRLVPRQCSALAGGSSRAMLGVVAAHLDMAELRVRNQAPIEEKRGADAGPQRHEEYGPALPSAGPEPHLGDSGGIGIIEHHGPP